MKKQFVELFKASMRGLIYVILGAPFLSLSVFVLGIVAKQLLRILLFAFNLF